MNGMRTARKYLERLTSRDLEEMLKHCENQTTNEEMVIYYLIRSELEKRKRK